MRMSRTVLTVSLVIVLVVLVSSSGDIPPSLHPGALGGGVTLLPNGWKIAPAGRHVQVGSLPLAMTESPDGRSLFIATNGYMKPAVTVVDVHSQRVRDVLVLDHAWLGLAWHPGGTKLYVSGARNSTVHELKWEAGKLTRNPDLVLGRPMPIPEPGANRPDTVPQSFVGGIAVTPDGTRLFAVHVLGQIVSAVDLRTGHVVRCLEMPAEPYTCIVSADGRTLFVSLWGGAKVLMFDASTLQPRGEVVVGEHPNAMALTKNGRRLFVACANTNAVWAVDVEKRQAVEQIGVAMFPKAPPGSTPNSVSLSPDEKRLIVANADNNTVAVIDVSAPGKSEVQGFIPTGWYPTAATISRDGAQVYVLSGKGLTSSANPRSMPRAIPGGEGQYVGATLTGTLSILPNPDASALQTLTKMAYSVTAYSDEHLLSPANAPAYGNVAAPLNGYIWDAAARKHVSYRSYGEFAHWGPGTTAERVAGKVPIIASVPGLVGHINPNYPPWEVTITDSRRVDVWLEEFTADDAKGQVPGLSIIRLGNDHTNGTRPGTPTPRALVAENDLALGRLVEAISKSRVWNESAVFVLEDDAQSGPDHVDAHRSPALVISPFSRRRAVDSTMYTTSGMLRTMELILGLPPMSQYDASATPMYRAMQATPDVAPFVRLAPRVSVGETNDALAYGAEASLRMNLADADLAPERELNEILWRSIKGPGAVMPPAARNAFVRRPVNGDADDDGDRR